MSTGEDDRPTPPRWSWSELILLFLFGAIAPALVYEGLLRAGFFHALYGPEAVEAAAKSNVERMRLYLWALALAWPVQIGGVLALLWSVCRATPDEAGLHARDLGRQVWLALRWAIGLIPAVYVVQVLAVGAMKGLGVPVVQHDFTKLAAEGLTPAEWALLAFAAVIVAPVWEELFFRGLVQRWVIGTGREAEAIALGVALFAAVAARVGDLWTAADGRAVFLATLPALCVLVLIGVWWLLPRKRGPLPGLFATAVLFAFIHTAAWPSPIPLLLLALGLGYLAHETKGIVGAIVLHAVFNAVAFVLLMVLTLRG